MHACMEKKHVTQVPTFLLAYWLTAYFQRIYLCGEATEAQALSGRVVTQPCDPADKHLIVLKFADGPVKIHPQRQKYRLYLKNLS